MKMETEVNNGDHTAHCLLVPLPFQGHINPILQFAKRLSHKRLKITLALTRSLLKTTPDFSAGSISVRSISDGFDEGGLAAAKSFEDYVVRFREVGQQTLSELLQDLSDSGQPVDCVIYDPFIPWVLDVAKLFGLIGAAFFTQSCTVDTIYYLVSSGQLKLPLRAGEAVALPGLPLLKPEEMPSFIYEYGSYPSTFQVLLGQFGNVNKADWIFINTFYKLEEEVINWFSQLGRVRAIGPTIPSMYLDKRLQDDREYGLSLFTPSTKACMDWLDRQRPKSIIYASFGSLAELSINQMQELALALTTCNRPFLWVVRSSFKLPKGFSHEKGLIVRWCPQLQVLTHSATGCFITHCGWNSALESLSFGVSVVAMPQWTDQATNSKLVEDVWKVGIRAHANEKGLVSKEEIIRCIKHVMGKGCGEDNANKWKEMAREAMDEGGTSDKNIEEFVSSLTSFQRGLNC